MASWGQAGSKARTAVLAGGAVAVAAAGAVAWWLSRDVAEGPQAGTPAALMAPEPAATPEPALAPAPDTNPPETNPPETPAPVSPAPPSFDLVRVEADGAAQVAGRGAPQARMLLQVDGAEVAQTAVAGDGAFVALFTLPPNPQPSLLSLVMVMPDGTRIPGRDTVALAPIAGPVLAVAEPAPAAASADPVADSVAEPPAALLVTDQGVQVLQAPPGADALAVSIDTISYTADGAVQFGGQGQAAQVVRLYLDNAELAEAAVTPAGRWGVTAADIAPGRYTLRADQLDAEGKVSSRFETPFQRETLAALAQAAAPQAPGQPPQTAPELAPAEGAPAAAVTDGASPEVLASAGPEAPAAPATLPEPPLPALPPLVSAPAKILVVDPVAPAEPGAAKAAAAPADPVTAAPDPAPAAVAATPAVPAPTADPAPAATPSPVSITVQPGLTLWAIAEANFGNGIRYVQVYEANKDQIRDPDLIYPGQVFTVPAEP